MTGADIALTRVPTGFTQVGAYAKALPRAAANGDGKAYTRVYEAADKPWIGPGGPVGRRIYLDVLATPETGWPTLPTVAGDTLATLGTNDKVIVNERTVPLKTPAGAWVDTSVSTVRVYLNNGVQASLTGEGVTARDLLNVAANVVVK